jgi:hypothetical protein
VKLFARLQHKGSQADTHARELSILSLPSNEKISASTNKACTSTHSGISSYRLVITMDDDPYSELDNEEQVYVGFHDAMMKMYANKNPKCFEVAAQLIAVSLPDICFSHVH